MNARTQAPVRIDLRSTVRTRIPTKKLLDGARAVLHGRVASGELSLIIVGDRRMASLHESSMGIAGPTDVLAFHHGDTPVGELLEVIVCSPEAARNAKRHSVPFAQEVVRYAVHGTLHCVGYDDHRESDRTKMWSAQESIMQHLFGKRYQSP